MMAFGKANISQAGPSSPDKLPVVEIKPFTKQEWRPSKSLPDVHDTCRTHTAMSSASSVISGVPSRKSGHSMYSMRSSWPDPEKPQVSPRSPDPSPLYRLPPATDRPVTQRAPKPKEGKLIEQRKQAFAHPVDREKTTIEDIKSGNSANIKHSFLRRTQSEDFVTSQQDIKVQGMRMANQNAPVNILYASHWEYYKVPKSYSMPAGSLRGTSSQSAKTIEDLCLRIEHLQQAYIDDGIYDPFDRASALPSITVRNAPMRRRKIKKENIQRQSSAKVIHKPSYRLGVANSLDVLSHYGKPVKVERQLTMHLKNTINSLRRTKDVSLMGGATKIMSKGHEPNTTPGEYMLQMNLDSNSNGFFRRAGHTSRTNRTWPDGGAALSRSTTGMQMYDSGAESYYGDKFGSPQKMVSALKKSEQETPLFQMTNTLPLISPASPTKLQAGSALDQHHMPESGLPTESLHSLPPEKMPKICENESHKSHITTPSVSSFDKPKHDEIDGHVKLEALGPKGAQHRAEEGASEGDKPTNESPQDTTKEQIEYEDSDSSMSDKPSVLAEESQDLETEDGETKKSIRIEIRSASSVQSRAKPEEVDPVVSNSSVSSRNSLSKPDELVATPPMSASSRNSLAKPDDLDASVPESASSKDLSAKPEESTTLAPMSTSSQKSFAKPDESDASVPESTSSIKSHATPDDLDAEPVLEEEHLIDEIVDNNNL